jgi:hypothetical protein
VYLANTSLYILRVRLPLSERLPLAADGSKWRALQPNIRRNDGGGEGKREGGGEKVRGRGRRAAKGEREEGREKGRGERRERGGERGERGEGRAFLGCLVKPVTLCSCKCVNRY